MNSDDFSISVIVPVTDMADRLRRMEKWISEADKRIEVIIVHDYRDQQTLNELVTLSTKYGIEIINGVYGSPGAARNAGIQKASKNWIIFVDSDDFPEIPRFIKMIQDAEIRRCEVSVGSYLVMDSKTDLKLWDSMIPVDRREQIKYFGTDPGVWRYAFKRSLIGDIKFPDLSMAEDIVFLSLIHATRPSIYVSEEIVYNYYRNDPKQLTNGKFLHKDSLHSLKLLLENKERGNLTFPSISFFFYAKLFNTVMVRGGLRERFMALRLTSSFIWSPKSLGTFIKLEMILAREAGLSLFKILLRKIGFIR